MKHYLTSAILMAAGLAYAQTPALYDCIYRYQLNSENNGKNVNETTDCILQIGEDSSKFYDYAVFQLDSVAAVPGVTDEVRQEYENSLYKTETYFDQTLLTSLPDNEITVYCDMAPDHYKYEQQLPLINWNLTEDKDNICGYMCRKATGEYGGRNWTVWFAEDIPVPFGPWKMAGLPGLVLKAIDNDSIHKFEAITIRKATGEIEKPSIPNVNSISHEKFIQRKNIYDLDPYSTIDTESISEITVTGNKNVLINGIRIRTHKEDVIPLEYTESELKKISKGEKLKPEKVTHGEIKVIGYGSSLKR